MEKRFILVFDYIELDCFHFFLEKVFCIGIIGKLNKNKHNS